MIRPSAGLAEGLHECRECALDTLFVSANHEAALEPHHRWPRVAMVAVALASLVPVLVLTLGSRHPGSVGAATNGAAMPLQEFNNDGANGRLWNSYDRTDPARGPTISGRPAPVYVGGLQNVFVRQDGGDLVQYVDDNLSGRAWNTYDLTTGASGPQIAGDPAAVVLNHSTVYVLARAVSGDLYEFTNNGSGSQLWSATDVSSAAGVGPVQGDVSVIVVGSALDVFAQSANNSLVELSGTGSGTRSWTTSNLSQAAGGPAVSGSPGAVLYGQTSIHVYAMDGAGSLYEFVNDGAAGHPWSSYDLTQDASGPAASGQPAAIVYGPTVHVYVNAGGHLTEFVNDGANRRLWNSYDLTSISHSPAITGEATAIFYTPSIVDLFAQGPSGHLITYVNDGAGGRLWNSYDLTSLASGPTVGADPTALVSGPVVSVFAAGPSASQALNQIVALAQSQDQNHQAVVENPPGSNCNIYSGFWGRGTTAGCAPGTSAQEWCSDFAQWVWANVGIDTSGINGWAFTWVSWGQDHTGAWQPGPSNNPQPGDVVVWGDMASGYAAHVGIVSGVSAGLIDVVSGNAGPVIDAAGDVDAVWDSGYFDPTTSTDAGYPVIGYVSPVGWSGVTQAAHP
ncbi:MAG: CHAP domain-containing protein, partial [Acidimicrobiales bacterium]